MQDFSGISEKLIRAKENIRNLDTEIETFFQKSDYPVIPHKDRKAALEAIEYHKSLVIPPRFSVLSGEIVHHLRSCFDHIVWHFSVASLRDGGPIEFPVFKARPIDKKSVARFEGKIKGIANRNVIALIEALQPYNSPDPLDNSLWVIHDFDIIDKHKELVLCFPAGTAVFPIEMEGVVEDYKRRHPKVGAAQIARQFEGYCVTQPNVAFRNFGRRKVQPVTKGLIELYNFTFAKIEDFKVL